MRTILPARKNLLVMPFPTEHDTLSGLSIPESAIQDPGIAIVAVSGRGSKCFTQDHVQYMQGALNKVSPQHALIPERFCFALWSGRPGEDVSAMKMHDGWVLIQIPYVFATQTTAGLSVAEEITGDEGKNVLAVRYGKVVQASRHAYSDEDMIVSSYSDKDDFVDVKKGDTVFFSAYVIKSILQGLYHSMSYFRDPAGNYFVMIPYKELIAKVSDGKIHSLNQYCIAEKVENSVKKRLSFPGHHKSAKFIDHYISVCDVADIKAGEKLVLPSGMDGLTLEAEALQTLPKKLYYFKADYAYMSFDNQKISFTNSRKA